MSKKDNIQIKKQKILIWLTIIITAANLLLVVAFVVYLYFWIKGRS